MTIAALDVCYSPNGKASVAVLFHRYSGAMACLTHTVPVDAVFRLLFVLP